MSENLESLDRLISITTELHDICDEYGKRGGIEDFHNPSWTRVHTLPAEVLAYFLELYREITMLEFTFTDTDFLRDILILKYALLSAHDDSRDLRRRAADFKTFCERRKNSGSEKT